MPRLSRLLPTASIGFYLATLAAVIALPLIGFVVFLLLRLEVQQRENLNRDTEEDAGIIARSIDRELRDGATTLQLVATSPELKTGDLRNFHNRTQQSLLTSHRYILLVDAEGNQKLNTRRSFGDALPRIADMSGLQSVLKSRQIEISPTFFGATSQRWVFNILQPLPPGLSQSGAALIMAQNADDLQRLIAKDVLPQGWSVVVLDQNDHVVTSTLGLAGQKSPVAQGTLDLMTGMSGTIEDVGGSPRLMYGYAKLSEGPWKVVVWGPIAAAQSNFISAWRYLVIGSLVLFTASMLLSYIVARQLRVPIRQIAQMAEKIGRGEIVSPVSTRITEANQIAVALSNASFDRSEAEDRSHLIMHELVHRTKNIMTLIQAMMRQLARRETSMPEFQRAIGERLQGLGKSIEMLAQEQWGGVPVRRVVALHLETFSEAKIRVRVEGPDFMLRAEAVQNLGLVLHELATNSVKYGALSVAEGKVDFSWAEVEGSDVMGEGPLIRMNWREHGGPPVEEPSSTGFGTTIIQRHAAAAFSGQVELDYRSDGFCWTLTGPRQLFERSSGDGQRDGF